MNMSNENRLLLCCTQTEIPEVKLDQVRKLLSLPLNWREVLESAFWHGTAPLVYHNLKDLKERQLIPEGVVGRLKKAHHKNMANNMHFYTELRRVLGAFNEVGIKVIVLKGAALAQVVYGNIALRPMGDIDLLVKREDVSGVEKVMSELGYLFQGDKSPEWYLENHHHVSYTHPERDIPIEIHWHIVKESHPSRIRINDAGMIERWWERSQAAEIAGKKALVLCPDDLLFHLSLHFLKHRFMSPNQSFAGRFTSRGALIQLSDIFQTLKHYGGRIDWKRLRFEADKYEVSGLIYSVLYIVGELIDNHNGISQDVLNKFTPDSHDKGLIKLMQKRILIREEYNLPDGFIQSLLADTFQKKLSILLGEIFPDPEALSKRYSVPPSSKRLYFYYLIRPFRLLLKYGRLMLRTSRIKQGAREEEVLNRWIKFRD